MKLLDLTSNPYLLQRTSGTENIGKKRQLKVTANSTFTSLL